MCVIFYLFAAALADSRRIFHNLILSPIEIIDPSRAPQSPSPHNLSDRGNEGNKQRKEKQPIPFYKKRKHKKTTSEVGLALPPLLHPQIRPRPLPLPL